MQFLHPAMWHDNDTDFVRWLHPAMWHVALESWQWIHQVATPCNVIRGSGMICHWIRPNVRHIGILHLVLISTNHCSQHVILYQSPKFYPPSAEKNDVMSIFKMADLSHLGYYGSNNITFYRLSRHHSSTLLSFPENCIFAFWRQYPRWQISAILDFRGPIMGF